MSLSLWPGPGLRTTTKRQLLTKARWFQSVVYFEAISFFGMGEWAELHVNAIMLSSNLIT